MKSSIRKILLAAGMIAATLGVVNAGVGPGRYAFNQDNAPGWVLMTPAERIAHRDRMLALKTLDECRTYMAQHHEQMLARATEKGVTLRGPRFNACEQMQVRGFLK